MEVNSFLIAYALLVVGSVIGLLYYRSTVDRSDRLSIPPFPSNIDPFEVAYLRGGSQEFARTVVFSLRQKGVIEIWQVGKQTRLQLTDERPSIPLSAAELRAVSWLTGGRHVRETFGNNGSLEAELAGYSDAYQRKLESMQLLLSHDLVKRVNALRGLVIVGIVGIGVAGMLAGPDNTAMLVGILAAAGILTAIFAGKAPRVTDLGRRFLERLKTTFSALNRPSRVAQETHVSGPDPLLLSVGIFGGVALAGTAYGDYTEAYKKGQLSSGSSGGCGGGTIGCGSCGSSCASDGGGSSCSGGCGGCGGGD